MNTMTRKEVEQYLQDLAILHYDNGKDAQAKNDHTTAAYHLGKHDAFNIALATVKEYML